MIYFYLRTCFLGLAIMENKDDTIGKTNLPKKSEINNRLYFYLQEKYKETNFPFFGHGDLYIKGVFDKDEANMLFKEGKIKIRQGANGKIIELIVEKT